MSTELYKALLLAQQEMPVVKKDSPNPFFKSKYATLDSIWSICKPILNKHGLVVIQKTGKDELGHFVETEVIHAESGGKTGDKCYATPEKNSPQAIGSAITYARRYSLQSVLMITPEEDDDGNAGSQPDPVQRQNQREQRDQRNAAAKPKHTPTRAAHPADNEPLPDSDHDLF